MAQEIIMPLIIDFIDGIRVNIRTFACLISQFARLDEYAVGERLSGKSAYTFAVKPFGNKGEQIVENIIIIL